jgi:hypothetical protein
VPPFASVSGYWEVASLDDPAITETWLAVDLLDAGAVGWLKVPPGRSIEMLVDGPYCQPDRDLHRFEQSDAGALFPVVVPGGPAQGADSPSTAFRRWHAARPVERDGRHPEAGLDGR